MPCVMCGTRLPRKAGPGRPAVYCPAVGGRAESDCMELAQKLRRVEILIGRVRERAGNGGGDFGVELRGMWRTFFWLANKLRPREWNREPAGTEGAGRFKKKAASP